MSEVPHLPGSSDYLRLVSAEFSLRPSLVHPRPQLPRCPCTPHSPATSLCWLSASSRPLSGLPVHPHLTLAASHSATRGSVSRDPASLASCPKGPGALPRPLLQLMHCSSELPATHAPCCLSPALPSPSSAAPRRPSPRGMWLCQLALVKAGVCPSVLSSSASGQPWSRGCVSLMTPVSALRSHHRVPTRTAFRVCMDTAEFWATPPPHLQHALGGGWEKPWKVEGPRFPGSCQLRGLSSVL